MQQGVLVRINGAAPDEGPGPKTSCSVFDISEKAFHLLIDAGSGVAESVKKGASELGKMPDAILITHAHKGHTGDLAALAGQAKIYCTQECFSQISKEVSIPQSQFVAVQAGQATDIGPFSVVPVAADHGGLPGSVIYVIKARDSKIIAGWDFSSLPGADQSLLWNPDLLILGAETYNDHPATTGMISVSEAYNIARRWNAKESFIVHYSGKQDIEDAKNQWFRGPTKPLAPNELQKTIDEHLRVSGGGGKFSMKVAQQGMTWQPAAGDQGDVGEKIEITGLEKYLFNIEKKEDGKLNVTIEDSVNRLSAEFANPRASDGTLQADAIKSFMAKGPELKMSLVPQDQNSIVRINMMKGKKPVFAEDIVISGSDAQRLERYIKKNFAATA